MSKPIQPLWIKRMFCEHDFRGIDWIYETLIIHNSEVLNTIGAKFMCPKCAAMKDVYFDPKPVHPWLTETT